MKMKKIKFLGDFPLTPTGVKELCGYAVESSLPVRIVVHSFGREWVCTHFDSGLAFGRPQKSRIAAALYGQAFIEEKLNSGEWKRVIEKMNLERK